MAAQPKPKQTVQGAAPQKRAYKPPRVTLLSPFKATKGGGTSQQEQSGARIRPSE
jgi:hypothetical protein